MNRSTAEIVREYGPYSGAERVNGVTYDGQNVWFAAGDKLNAFDPASGKTLRSIDPKSPEKTRKTIPHPVHAAVLWITMAWMSAK